MVSDLDFDNTKHTWKWGATTDLKTMKYLYNRQLNGKNVYGSTNNILRIATRHGKIDIIKWITKKKNLKETIFSPNLFNNISKAMKISIRQNNTNLNLFFINEYSFSSWYSSSLFYCISTIDTLEFFIQHLDQLRDSYLINIGKGLELVTLSAIRYNNYELLDFLSHINLVDSKIVKSELRRKMSKGTRYSSVPYLENILYKSNLQLIAASRCNSCSLPEIPSRLICPNLPIESTWNNITEINLKLQRAIFDLRVIEKKRIRDGFMDYR
jgi:hypothetical protein